MTYTAPTFVDSTNPLLPPPGGGPALNADTLNALAQAAQAATVRAPNYTQVTGDTTGATDVSAAVSAAVTGLPSGGGTVELPAGTLLFAVPLVISRAGIKLIGSPGGNTTIVAGSGIGTNEVIRFTSAATGATCTDVTITATASANYAALRIGGPSARATRVTIVGGTGGTLRGIVTDSTATNCQLVECRVSGIRTSTTSFTAGGGIVLQGDDNVASRCVVTDCSGATGVYYQQMGGFIATGTTGTAGRRIRLYQCDAYSNGVHGVYATGCDHFTVDGGNFYSNGALATAAGGVGGTEFGRGISIGSAASIAPKIVNTHLFNNQENGLIIAGGGSGTGASDSSLVRNPIVANNQSYNNNQGAFAGGHGLEVNSLGGTVSGNICWNNHNGIAVSGVSIILTGNFCYGNTSTDSNQGAGIQLNFQGGTPAVLTATTTSGSNQITVASGGFPGVTEEETVTGTGIGSSTVVTQIAGNTATMSAAATASGTVSLTFSASQSRNMVVGNVCSRNDNFGVRAIGDTNHNGVVVSDNSLCYNGIAERSGASYDLSIASTCKSGVYRNNNLFSTTVRVNNGDTSANRGGNSTASDNGLVRSLTYGTTISWNGESSEFASVVVTDATAFTINPPTISYAGRRVTYRVLNSSGGAMGTITWAASFKRAGAFTNPATGTARLITFVYDGSNWIEISRSAADVS